MAELVEKSWPHQLFSSTQAQKKLVGPTFFHHFLELQRPSNIFNDTRRGKTCQAKTHIYPGPVLLANSALHQKVKKVEKISHTSPGSRRDYKSGAQLCKHKARGPLAASQEKHATLLSCPTEVNLVSALFLPLILERLLLVVVDVNLLLMFM